ncbi:MAG: BrnT family toxin, partial [Acidobacteriaceae bacterium]
MKRFVQYQWDVRKDAENRRKHGLSLEDGIGALEDPNAQSWVDNRSHGEWRFVTVGMMYPKLLVVVTAEPSEEVTRIISVRKAERHEKN